MIIKYKGNEIEVNENIKVIDLLKNEIENSEIKVIACICNNEVRSLNYEITEDTELELLNISEKDGMRIYIRGVLFIMGKAFEEIESKALVSVNHKLSDAMFCEIDNMETTEDLLGKLEMKMNEIVSKKLPIIKKTMKKEEAEEFYGDSKSLRGRLQLDTDDKNTVSLYFCEDYYNYFYGIMPINTADTPLFRITKYMDGFIIECPSRSNTKVIPEYKETKQLMHTLQEYKDIHKVLGVNTTYKLNKIVENGKINEFIFLAEALHEKKLSEIANEISNHDKIKMILIAGPTSSGKTSFAERLGIQLRLNGLKIVTLSVDNYFVNRVDTPIGEDGKYNFESINAIDLDLFNKDLSKLLNGEMIDVPVYDFKLGEKVYNGNKMKLKQNEILVVEGIHCLNDELTSSIEKDKKFKIYISALTTLNVDYYNRISTSDTRLLRRMVRDHRTRGYSALDTLKMWESVGKGEEQNIYPFQETADCMFNTSLIYELGVLKPYVVPLLEEIDSSNKEYSEARRLLEFIRYFEEIKTDNIPNNSLLKEFIGGSVFHD